MSLQFAVCSFPTSLPSDSLDSAVFGRPAQSDAVLQQAAATVASKCPADEGTAEGVTVQSCRCATAAGDKWYVGKSHAGSSPTIGGAPKAMRPSGGAIEQSAVDEAAPGGCHWLFVRDPDGDGWLATPAPVASRLRPRREAPARADIVAAIAPNEAAAHEEKAARVREEPGLGLAPRMRAERKMMQMGGEQLLRPAKRSHVGLSLLTEDDVDEGVDVVAGAPTRATGRAGGGGGDDEEDDGQSSKVSTSDEERDDPVGGSSGPAGGSAGKAALSEADKRRRRLRNARRREKAFRGDIVSATQQLELRTDDTWDVHGSDYSDDENAWQAEIDGADDGNRSEIQTVGASAASFVAADGTGAGEADAEFQGFTAGADDDLLDLLEGGPDVAEGEWARGKSARPTDAKNGAAPATAAGAAAAPSGPSTRVQAIVSERGAVGGARIELSAYQRQLQSINQGKN